jgi:hypothetical protein
VYKFVKSCHHQLNISNTILHHFKQTAIISKNPRDITYSESVKILKESSFPLSSDEIIVVVIHCLR